MIEEKIEYFREAHPFTRLIQFFSLNIQPSACTPNMHHIILYNVPLQIIKYFILKQCRTDVLIHSVHIY